MTIRPQPPLDLDPRRRRSTLHSWLRLVGRTFASLLAVLIGAGIVLGAAYLMGGNVR
jgi:hypothetical protein